MFEQKAFKTTKKKNVCRMHNRRIIEITREIFERGRDTLHTRHGKKR